MPGFTSRQGGEEKKNTASKKHKARDQHLNLSMSAEAKARADRTRRKTAENPQQVSSATKSRPMKKTCLFSTADLEG